MMTLPKSMSRLVNLQRLDIGNNDFTELVGPPSSHLRDLLNCVLMRRVLLARGCWGSR